MVAEYRANDAEWIGDAILAEKPNVARMYDYLLGGFHNFQIDRDAADKMLQVYPDLRLVTYANRAFLRRVVNHLATQGIELFLDIGSGVPTVGNVHEVAHGLNPAAQVVYVDIDPAAVAHSRATLAGNPNATALRGDLANPEQILSHPDVSRLLDFGRPTAILLIAVLHYIVDNDTAYRAVRTLRDALAPGSYMAISHGIPETQPPEVDEQLGTLMRTASHFTRRSPQEVMRFFDDMELVQPGLVLTPLWNPEGPDDFLLNRPEQCLAVAALGRKP